MQLIPLQDQELRPPVAVSFATTSTRTRGDGTAEDGQVCNEARGSGGSRRARST